MKAIENEEIDIPSGVGSGGQPLLVARGLVRSYSRSRGWAGRASRARPEPSAVDGVDLDIRRGELLALVGESGSGKSTLARLLAVLERPDAGRIHFDGEDLLALGRRPLRDLRRRFQLVFQDSAAALDPRVTVGASIEEGLRAAGPGAKAGRAGRRARVVELLDAVDLSAQMALRYPHQLSGGQRQRVAIARALATEPELLILDEPVSALDAVVRERILRMLAELRSRFGLTVLFIGHDLGVISRIADRVMVMLRGRIMESGPVREVFGDPWHPYTRMLIRSVPSADPARARRRDRPQHRDGSGEAAVGPGSRRPRIPAGIDPGALPACAHAHDCERARADCFERVAELASLPGKEEARRVACHFPLVDSRPEAANGAVREGSSGPPDRGIEFHRLEETRSR